MTTTTEQDVLMAASRDVSWNDLTTRTDLLKTFTPEQVEVIRLACEYSFNDGVIYGRREISASWMESIERVLDPRMEENRC